MKLRHQLTALAAVLLTATGTAAHAEAPAEGGTAGSGPELFRAVTETMRADRGRQAEEAYGKAVADVLVEPKRAAGSWVFGGATFLVPADVDAGPVTALFLARRASGGWRVTLEGAPAFASMAKSAPVTVVKARERALFARTAKATKAAEAQDPDLSLPWEKDLGWGHWGVHGNSGTSRPYNSIDFYGPGGEVLTSRAGTMYTFCNNGGRWPFIRVIHDNGYTTGYYHLRDTTDKGDGSDVEHGEYMGMIAEELPCGGSANGDHVHWTLWQGNNAVAVDGKEIGGWTWHEEPTAYQGYAERDGRIIRRNRCCDLVNHGGGDTAS